MLLTNFFTSLGKKSFLVLGQAVPEGNTAYVMTVEENGEHWLWNPVTGEHSKTSETFCPLESVYAIVNESKKFIYILKYTKYNMVKKIV